jgi:hypothetical protein
MSSDCEGIHRSLRLGFRVSALNPGSGSRLRKDGVMRDDHEIRDFVRVSSFLPWFRNGIHDMNRMSPQSR